MTTTIPTAFPSVLAQLARRDSFVKQPARQRRKTRTTPAESLTLQSPEQRAELGYRRMQRSVAMLCCFFVGAYVSHPSVLDNFGTFININPFKSELFM